MAKHLERDLRSLEQKILAMSSQVEEMIEQATRSLRDHAGELASEVIRRDEAIDAQEVQIEEDCLKVLALHQPVAIDLRRTAAVLKINAELERIADLAVNIAERAQSLSAWPEFALPPQLEEMGTEATSMVREALDAFVRLDVRGAKQVMKRDEKVDALNLEVIEAVHEAMRRSGEMVEPALHFFSAARHLERIADHATNIAEDVVYLVVGEIARHKHAPTDAV